MIPENPSLDHPVATAAAYGWHRAGALFDAALEQPTEVRGAWLQAQCPEDPGLVREVAALLAAHQRSAGILERPPALAGNPPADEGLPPGLMLGPYRLEAEIGRGGMGRVYRGFDPRLERPVAIKVLAAGASTDPRARRRFLAEARITSRLDHPALCTVYDLGETADGRLFIAMAYYQGETLDRRIVRGPVPPGQAVEVVLQAARGLARAHEAGVVHRDVKPSNLLVTTRGEVKILDFGIAKLRGESLTQPGLRLGTLAYMAPEQVSGDPVDERTDVRALGLVLFELLTATRPFSVSSVADLLRAIEESDPPLLRERDPELPAALEAVVARALARRPADRFQTAAELAAALDSNAPRNGTVAPVVARALTAEAAFTSRRDAPRAALDARLGVVESLEDAAERLAGEGDAATSWRLLCAAAALRAELAVPLPVAAWAGREELERRLSDHLGASPAA